MCGRFDAVTERFSGLLAEFRAAFLVSDLVEGFPGFLPYAEVQAYHFGVGIVTGVFGPLGVGIVFIGWVAKEIVFDNLTFGGTALVAADSFADLFFGFLGYAVVRKQRRYSP